MNIFVTNIGNGSGKTLICAGIAAVMQSLGYNTGVYKPIQTEAIDKGSYLVSPDLTFVKMADSHIKTHCSYMFKAGTVPAAAALIEHININFDKIEEDYNKLAENTDILITESPGGLMTPIRERLFCFNIVQKLNLPVVFVITPSKGNINNYLNEINTAKVLNLNIAGVIINKYPVYSDSIEIKSFPEVIEKYSDIKILGLIRNFRGKSISTNALINEILNGIDLQELLKMKISKLNGV